MLSVLSKPGRYFKDPTKIARYKVGLKDITVKAKIQQKQEKLKLFAVGRDNDLDPGDPSI